ncbi:MAG TPA: hypothetical protein VL201_03200, partial [Patescibacteria group bacterium]|nr:hypothetical protein [Patescibacteria group bacterium]
MKYRFLILSTLFLIITLSHTFQAETTTAKEVVFFTSGEKSKLKSFLEDDTAARKIKLDEANVSLKRLSTHENLDPNGEKMKTISSTITALTNHINANTDLINKLIADKYTYGEVRDRLAFLGKRPQDLLQGLGVRGSFFSGENVEELFLEIDALNLNRTDQDIKLAFRKYTNSASDLDTNGKLSHISTLINRLLNRCKERHETIQATGKDVFLTKAILKDAVYVLGHWLSSFQKNATVTTDSIMNQKLKDATFT